MHPTLNFAVIQKCEKLPVAARNLKFLEREGLPKLFFFFKNEKVEMI